MIQNMITTCISMHNMIIKNESNLSALIQETIEVPNPKLRRLRTMKILDCNYF